VTARHKTIFGAAALAAVAVVLCGVTLGGMLVFAFWPYPLENFEGGCAWAAKIWAAGGGLYVDGLGGRVPIYNYPPLYVTLLRIFAVPGMPFLAGRLISVASVAGLAALAFAFVRRAEADRRQLGGLLPMPAGRRRADAGRFAAATAAAAVLLTRDNMLYGQMARCDALAAVLSLAGVWTAYWWASSRADAERRRPAGSGQEPPSLSRTPIRGSRRSFRLAASAAICVAAWFAKQTAVAAPIAVFVWLIANDWRAALRFAVYYALLLGGAIALAEMVFHGLFLRNVLGFSLTSYSLTILTTFLTRYFRAATWPWRAISVTGPVLGVLAARRGGWRQTPWLAYFAACVLGLATLGKEGASMFYFFEFNAACAVGFGLGIGRISFFDRAAGRAVLAGAALFLAAFAAADQYNIYGHLRTAGEADAVALVRRAPGPVLLEDSGYGLVAGVRQLDLINPFLATRLAERGKFDFSPWMDNIRAGRYALIQLESPAERPSYPTGQRFPPALLRQIAWNYVFVGVAGHGFFYVPKPVKPRSAETTPPPPPG